MTGRPPIYAIPLYKPCGHPGCEAKMQRGSGTYNAGFCARHGGRTNHRSAIVIPLPPMPPKDRPHVRVALVSCGTPHVSYAAPTVMRVSLSREPLCRLGAIDIDGHLGRGRAHG